MSYIKETKYDQNSDFDSKPLRHHASNNPIELTKHITDIETHIGLLAQFPKRDTSSSELINLLILTKKGAFAISPPQKI